MSDAAYHTRLIPADQAGALDQAAALLRAGETVAFPTETVYGLGANARDPAAVARIYAAKGRPSTDPLIVHIPSITAIDQVARMVPPIAYELAERFWPGPLTFVLPRATAIPSSVSAGLDTIAVRAPNHRIAQALLIASGLPIAAPSANRFAHTSPTSAAHVWSDLAGRIPLILDGGPCRVGVESTILDLTRDPPVILRPGGLSIEALRAVLPDVQISARYAHPNDGALSAPGMLLRHYAPNAPLYLYGGESLAIPGAITHETLKLIARGQHVGLLLADEDAANDRIKSLPQNVAIEFLGRLDDPETVARRLFAALRTLDDRGVSVILARAFPGDGLGAAVNDRLRRAADGKVFGD